jgi:hypothetical protein
MGWFESPKMVAVLRVPRYRNMLRVPRYRNNSPATIGYPPSDVALAVASVEGHDVVLQRRQR